MCVYNTKYTVIYMQYIIHTHTLTGSIGKWGGVAKGEVNIKSTSSPKTNRKTFLYYYSQENL